MKIGQPADKAALAPTTTTTRNANGEGTKSVGPAGSEASAKVVLSEAASALMSSTAPATADFDADKVARIGRAVADGSYVVNHGAIADKLIANTQELLRKHAH